jgi:hypothetical protein
VSGRQIGNYPETGLEDINSDLRKANFGTTSSESALRRNFWLAGSRKELQQQGPRRSQMRKVLRVRSSSLLNHTHKALQLNLNCCKSLGILRLRCVRVLSPLCRFVRTPKIWLKR